jgi:hypothetical protein
MKALLVTLGVLTTLFLILASAGCAELPASADDGGFFGPAGSTATPTPTPAYLTSVTPMPTQTPSPQPTFPQRPVSGQTAPEYFEIYNETLTFNYNATAFTYALDKPPMLIELDINPVMIKDVKSGDSSYGDKEEYTITKLVPSPLAEFSLRVIDLGDGSIVAEEGYGRAYSYTEHQLIRLYYPAHYQIEMRGSSVDVDVVIRVPEENIH